MARLLAVFIVIAAVLAPAAIDARGFTGQRRAMISDGATYDGAWVDGKRHGRGLQIWPNGERYEGEWRNDKRDG
ncbi:MAG: hypothetical protein AB7G10_06425, partial [Reyranellaceae bacterium]